MTTLTQSSPSLLDRSEPEPRASTSAVTKRTPRALIVLPSLALVVTGAGATSFALGRGKETTDDAQVEGHVASVSPRISGQVARVLVKDNQAVRAGDVLVELDPRDLSARLAAAKADLAAARAQLHASETQLAVTTREVSSELTVARGGLEQASAVSGTTRAAITQANADIAAAEAQRTLAATELERTRTLLQTGAQSQAQYDARKAGLEQAEAALSQARARLASAESNISNSSGAMQNARGRLIAAQTGPQRVESATAQVELARARVDQAEAALEQATLNLSYTRIRAEVAGVVSRRTVEAGQMVSPERPLLALVPLDDTWVVANFKEDQIADVHAGERAEVSVDTFHGVKLSGHVDSLASGTGARFSLLPPDNASGNFTKVVQRVPVLIRLDPHPELELRPGLSAVATVFTK